MDELYEKEKELIRELEDFKKEKERIRKIIGRIGGKNHLQQDKIINAIFLLLIIVLFVLEITTHFLPPFISLELSVLLVSIKIVWMIHSQHKVNHFQFWVLNSIEFRVNEMYRRLGRIEKYYKEK